MSDKNLESELACILSVKYTPDFGDLVWKKFNNFYIDYILK